MARVRARLVLHGHIVPMSAAPSTIPPWSVGNDPAPVPRSAPPIRSNKLESTGGHVYTARGQRKGGEGVTSAMIRARIRVGGKLEGDLQALSGAPLAAYRGCGERDGRIGHGKRRSRGPRWRELAGTFNWPDGGSVGDGLRQAGNGMARSRARARLTRSVGRPPWPRQSPRSWPAPGGSTWPAEDRRRPGERGIPIPWWDTLLYE